MKVCGWRDGQGNNRLLMLDFFLTVFVIDFYFVIDFIFIILFLLLILLFFYY